MLSDVRRSALLTILTTAAAVAAATAAAPAALAAGPSRATAQRYAHRTYVNDSSLGRRRFEIIGPRATAHAADGSTITAFAMVLADSGDGTGQAVELFRETRFLGWASAFDTVHLSVSGSGTTIRVRYGVYTGNDPFCCPSSKKTIRYRWTGGRIKADGTPPKIYGKNGSRLHLTP
jgi:hypothetical protein